MDGDPFEVAERAVRQAEAMAKILSTCIASARLMARNAQMERDLLQTGECNAAAYDESAEGRRFDAISDRVRVSEDDLRVLAAAAGFNPKRPLNAG